ncbi:MAG: hypothetical protein E6G17_04785 [Actinobacteria bacterium]|nr:MAG: hypothetical protein E6G17_04785 [Actinomycetota bacterium]
MRWVRRVVIGLLVVVVLGGALTGFWVADRSLHPDHSKGPYGVRILGLRGDRIELSRTTDTASPGVYRLEWHGGWAQISAIVTRGKHDVVRRVDHLEGSAPAPETRARVREPYVGDPGLAFGLPFDDVAIPGAVGRLPAWVVPAPGSTWAILLHGYGGTREDMLYLVPALHAAGVPAMLVSYRNDPGAARGSHGFTLFGQAEWHDVDAAVAFARAHGATGVVLLGASMGGTVACEYLRHGSQSSFVRGAVLDAPGLDLRSDMHYGARTHGFRGPLNWAVIGLGQDVMRVWARMNFDDLDELAHAREFRVPILIFHGEADDVSSVAHSRTLARERRDLVRLVTTPRAGHVHSWNVDRSRYEATLTQFLHSVGVR